MNVSPGAPAGLPEPEEPAEVSPETLMLYMDGELSPGEAAKVETALARSTEVQRELAVFRMFHRDLTGLRLHDPPPGHTTWDRIHGKLSRPMGWILMGVGAAAWTIHLLWVYLSSTAPSWEKMATSAVVIGVLVLFASVIHERYLEWQTDPYRDIER